MYVCLSMSMSTCMCIYMYVYVYMYICTRNCICICRASRIWKVVWQLFNPLPNQLLLLIVSRLPCSLANWVAREEGHMSPVKANVGAVGVLIQSRRVLGSRFDPKNDPKNDPRNPRDEIRSLPRWFLLAKCRCSTLERVQQWAMQLHCPIPRGGPLMKLSSDHYNINWH